MRQEQGKTTEEEEPATVSQGHCMRSALTHYRITNRHFPSGVYWHGCFHQSSTRMTFPNVQDCADRCTGVCLLYFSEMTSLTSVSVRECARL